MTCRTSLTADITIPVGAGTTLQAEYDRLAADYDMRGFSATFILSGTATGCLSARKPLVGGNLITIDGGGVTLNAGGAGKTAIGNFVSGMTINLRNVKISSWNGANSVVAVNGGIINMLDGIEFLNGEGDHILASYGGQVFIKSNYTVSGGGLNHWHSYSGGYITATDITVNVTAGIWFVRWAGVADAGLIARNVSYIGNINGAKYLVHKNGFMEIGAATLPGSTPGETSTGGVIA
ncbi:hypothetical protein G6L41_008620 [Agrobacterium tumefaciens]|uniref:hypothetical protein n=1 Tax=Agrobacterium tumefaciens TaxID=358 RepID=UPI0015745E76|nr:hypothetical protein [Agrobacterium tumefaciens]WCK12332.1 hypothetical protein G6L41_008620 [Agrobacterium tumefaciens]